MNKTDLFPIMCHQIARRKRCQAPDRIYERIVSRLSRHGTPVAATGTDHSSRCILQRGPLHRLPNRFQCFLHLDHRPQESQRPKSPLPRWSDFQLYRFHQGVFCVPEEHFVGVERYVQDRWQMRFGDLLRATSLEVLRAQPQSFSHNNFVIYFEQTRLRGHTKHTTISKWIHTRH